MTYETANQVYPMELPDPIDALRFRMEQAGLEPKDLIPYIGSKSKVSEVLSRKRPLSLPMIRRLVAGLSFPAAVALRVPHLARPRRRKRKAIQRQLQTADAG